MKVGVAGAGYVGLVTAACFADLGHQVTSVDNDAAKIELLKKGKVHFYEPGLDEMVLRNFKKGRIKFTSDLAKAAAGCDVMFIAVGTPPKDNGDADLSAVEAVARVIAKNSAAGYKLIIEKSTVPVQTGQRIQQVIADSARKGATIDVASNPEFLREGSAIHDFLHPDRIVLGTESARARKVLKELYKGIQGPILFTDIKSAEIIKHASNSFLSMKISFINAISRVCELAGADVEEVAEGMGLDKRIGRNFLNAGIGFGGFCFPKDLAAFIHISDKLGYDFRLLRAVEEVNAEQRKHYVKKVEEALWNVSGKTIAVWGLAFKPNTDDMRFAPALDIIEHLKSHGAKIKAYDPKSMEKSRDVLKGIQYCKDMYEACKDADCLLVITEWKNFKDADLKKVKKLMSHPLVVDGRNLYAPADMKKLGFRYISMGRGPVGVKA